MKSWFNWMRRKPLDDHQKKLRAHTSRVSQMKVYEREILKLNKAIEQSPVSIVITNLQGDIEYINPHVSRLTGYSPKELIGQNPRILKSGDVKAEFYRCMWDTLLAGKEWRGEFKNKKKNGETYYEYAVISPVFDDNGIITNFVGVKEDITERKKTEEAIKENEKILEEAQQLSRAGHIIIDFRSNTFKCSPVVDDIFGIDASFEKTMKNFAKLIDSEYYDQMFDYYTHYIPKAINPLWCEFKSIRYSDKQEVWIYIKGDLEFGEFNEPKTYIGIVQDITERKKVEHDLLLNNERLEGLLKIANYEASNSQELLDLSLEEAINLTESKIGYLYLYDETTKMFKNCSWSKNIKELCSVNNPYLETDLSKVGLWGEVVRQRKPILINNYNESVPNYKGTPLGHVQLKRFLSIPVIVNKKIVAVVGVANKDTHYNQMDMMQLTLMMDTVWKNVDRQKMIEELVAAKEKAEESDRLKSAFLANMSHEIRTPMNAVLGFSELLTKAPASPESVEKYADIIHSRSTYLLTLIDDILDLSKVEAGILSVKLAPFRLNELFDDITAQTKLKLQKQKKDIELIVIKERQDNQSAINSDKDRIQQLLVNLIDNAIKFTQQGSITIKYHADEVKGVVVSVVDTGIGISAKDQQVIFDRFHKSNDRKLNYSGLGLGLSISKGIVKMLGGEIWVESEVNKGSEFSFNIPVSFIEVKKNRHKEDVSMPTPRPKGIILLVEDDEFNLELFKSILSGFDLLIAEDGFSALDTYQKNKNIDLIFMDIGLPDISGLDVTKKIRETNTTIPIVAITAYAGESDRQKCMEAGCNDFLAKPVESAVLLTKASAYLANKEVFSTLR
jgi:PAS domain S-box-containing protein